MRELCIWHLAGERGGFKERNIISGLCCRSLSFFTSIQILTDYPEELRGDVSLHLHKEILSLPIFETASEGCRKLLSLTIKTNFCAPNEFLIHKGDALQNIFYLFNGSMEVLQDGMVVAILGESVHDMMPLY